MGSVDNLENTGPLFYFFDDLNYVIYLGRKFGNKIFCFEFNQTQKRLEFNNQVIPIDGSILSICSVPRIILNNSINEIMRYVLFKKISNFFIQFIILLQVLRS
jgi:hypothetical protein